MLKYSQLHNCYPNGNTVLSPTDATGRLKMLNAKIGDISQFKTAEYLRHHVFI